MLILQSILIFFKKQTRNSNTFIILDSISKLSVGAFLYLFFLFHKIDGFEYGDILVLQFAGILILLDINYIDLLKALREYIYIPRIPVLES